MAARSSIPAAIPPSKPRSRWPPAPSAAPRCPPAPPPVRARRWSCAMATSKRYLGKGVLKAVGHVNTVLRDGAAGPRRPRPGRARCAHDRARRHRHQGTPRRQRAAGGFAGRGARRRARCRAAAVPLSGRRARAGDARADDEHHQRRRARQQQPRHPGVHDPAGGRAVAARGAALRRRGVPHAEEAAERAGHDHRRGRRGRLCARPAVERSGAADHPARRSRQAGYKPGQGHLSRPRRRQLRVLPRRQVRARVRAPQLLLGGIQPLPRPTSRRATRSSPSRMAWARPTGPAGRT